MDWQVEVQSLVGTMQIAKKIEGLLEEVEALAHSDRSPELISLVLAAAWALQRDVRRSKVGGGVFERTKSSSISDLFDDIDASSENQGLANSKRC